MPSRRITPLVLVVLLGLPVLLAAVVAVAVLAGGSGGDGDDEGGSGSDVVDLEAQDAVPIASLEEMVGASACVAAGEVVAAERGRELGSGLVSRLVEVRVDRALAGDCPEGVVVVEEEGWLADGAEVSVNGWVGSAEGDVGVWFLVPGPSDELPYASTVSTSGSLRWRAGRSLAPATAPAWVLEATAGGFEELVGRVEEAQP